MPDLILLHGPPASGKLTIAKQLSVLTGARVFHNHLTLDVAKSLFNFGDPEFWALVHDLRILSYKAYFQNGSGTAIATWCYEGPEDQEAFLEIKTIANAAKGRVLPVFLSCELSFLENRVANAHRCEMEKLSDVKQLREVMLVKNYCAIPDELCIEINSGTQSALSNAQRIVSEFNLSDRN